MESKTIVFVDFQMIILGSRYFGPLATSSLNPNRTGLFLTCLDGGGGGRDIIFVVCGPIAKKFCTGIDSENISSNMKKICIKLMTS